LKEALRRKGSAVAVEVRKKYRAVIWRKKRMFSKARTAQLSELVAKRQQPKFWGRFKKRLNRVVVKSKAEWHGYCKGLYTGEASERRGSDQWQAETINGEDLAGKRAKAVELNEYITEAEVV
jgi:hypothetical protein